MALDWELAILVAVLGSFWAVQRRVDAALDCLVDVVDRTAYQLEGLINLSSQDTVDAVVAQLAKAKGEIVAKLADVQAQLDAAGVADKVDLSALVDAAKALDDVVPDPVVEPAPVDPPVDPTV